jgi:hypothetical protein
MKSSDLFRIVDAIVIQQNHLNCLTQRLAMPNLTSRAGQVARCCTSQRLAAARAPTTALSQKRFDSHAASNWGDTRRIPDFSKYRSKASEEDNRTFQYVMVGTMGALAAMGAKGTVVGEFGMRRHCMTAGLTAGQNS